MIRVGVLARGLPLDQALDDEGLMSSS